MPDETAGITAIRDRVLRTREQMRVPSRHPRVSPPAVSPDPSPASAAEVAYAPATPSPPATGRRRSKRMSDNNHTVYLDARQEQYVREIELAALAAGERIGASTILRAGLDLLMASGQDWTELRRWVRRPGPTSR